MKHISKIVISVLIVVTSCKTNKSIVNGSEIKNITTKKIISNHYANNFHQKTVYAKLNAKYRTAKTKVSINIKLRLEKDKTIWMSASKLGIPLAKVKITPTKVMYYEKIKKTYFVGDFSLLSKWLGTELDFEKVQNILLGQALFDLKKGKYNSLISENSYQLSPKRSKDLFEVLFFVNMGNFKLNKQVVRNTEKQQLLSISYRNYNNIKGEQFPKNIDIRATDTKKITTINIEYRSLEFNRELTFPFSIPKGYKKIRLK